MNSLFTLVLLSFSVPCIAGAVPDWAKDRSHPLSGNIYKAVCSGQGPSPDLARQEALSGCKAAASQLLQRDGSVKSLTIESEKDVSYYQEVSQSVSFRNLTCLPEKESISEEGAGSYKVWLMCKFDLSKAAVGKDARDTRESANETTPEAHLSSIKERKFDELPANRRSHAVTSISLAIVPACSKVLIRGKRPRTVICGSGVVSLPIEEGDKEAIITAPGYVSKVLNLTNRTWSSHEVVQVILEGT